MNKLFTFIAFTTFLILLPQKNNAQCHMDDWKALKALYTSTNGDNWSNKTGWNTQIANQNNPPANCDLSDLFGVEVLLGRVWKVDLSDNALSGSLPDELGSLTYLVILDLDTNHICGIIPPSLGDLPLLTQINFNDNALSGCYLENLSQLCDQIEAFLIFGGFNTMPSWDDFCNTNTNTCFAGKTYPIMVSTNYSGVVEITSTFNQTDEFMLKNNHVEIMHYPACTNGDFNNCNVVKDFNNRTANEVSWATEKATDFFNNLGNFNVPVLKSFTHCNYDNRVNEAVLNSASSTIYYGKGDSIERYTMTAPDIIGRTYTHHLTQQSDEILTNFSNYSESGALKESFADIFGEMVENACYGQNDWIVGRQVIASAVGATGIRSLNNPADENMQYQLPDTYNGTHWSNLNLTNETSNQDFIQFNNGIHNHWFYLLAEGGSGLNDDGVAYAVNGIGKALATQLAFANFSSLKPNSTYYDAVLNSINLAKTDFTANPALATEATQAWKAVGLPLNEIRTRYNPIDWRLDNYRTNGVTQYTDTDGTLMRPRLMDLIIDSLGQDISGDKLSVTLQIPENFRNFEIDHVYPPLSLEQLDITYKANEVTISIDRKYLDFGKTNGVPRIASGAPIFRVGVCIVVIDLGVISNNSMFRITNNNQSTVDGSKTAHFFVIEDTNTENSLILSNKLTHQDCLALGSMETTVSNTINTGIAPYNYYLYDASGNAIESELSTNEKSHQFNHLEIGTYILRVEDNANLSMEFSFNIVFEARRDGNTCCPNKLYIPSGNVEGVFNAIDEIEINSNTIVESGSFTICN